ncbi:MAG TPA: hypothetical protein VFV42_04690 [Acidimicrobiales bacterium]|nr:hypothetical protein [Acidimicrobiales bacterium]
MATRIEIELTSLQDEGRTFTWRAAGARQPKGVVDSTILPEGSAVGDELRVEAEMDLDGIRITQVLPPKAKETKKVETLELITRDEGPLVTQVLAEKGRGRGDRGDRRGGRRSDRPRGEGDRGARGDRGDRGERGERRPEGRGGERRDSGRPRTPAKPKLPPKPKPPRLKAGKANRNELIDSLPEEHKAVAQELLRGGLQAVRQGLEKQNEQRKAEGQGPIDEGPIVTLAEQLLVKVRAAEWRDRAEAALEQATVVDLRDLRTVVTAADGAAKDDESRALAARLRTALNERLDADQQAWVAEVVEMLDDDRVVRALHLSSRPPKAGAPLPADVAMRLVEASNAAMSSETSTDRWIYILDALAHSPVRRQVVPVSLPANVSDELKGAIARHGTRLPEIAQIFGIDPDPKAGRPEARRKRKPGTKPKADRPKGDKAKDEKPTAEGEKAEAAEPEVQAEAAAEVPDVPEDLQQAPAEAPAPEIPAAEALEAEQSATDEGTTEA